MSPYMLSSPAPDIAPHAGLVYPTVAQVVCLFFFFSLLPLPPPLPAFSFAKKEKFWAKTITARRLRIFVETLARGRPG